MGEASIITAVLVIAILVSTLVAVTTGFIMWLDSKRPTAAILGAGGAFLAVMTLMVSIFTSIGPLNG
ncbi:hypothetical protein [Streptosporangium saharense]|uniref:hypothetical protein n=1 Tax=Streptosporangium saharense TaxID=1706840 RepID=UPI003322B1E3